MNVVDVRAVSAAAAVVVVAEPKSASTGPPVTAEMVIPRLFDSGIMSNGRSGDIGGDNNDRFLLEISVVVLDVFLFLVKTAGDLTGELKASA